MTFLDSFDYGKDLSLYIHIPFCFRKCSYCAFFSAPSSDCEVSAYTDKLISEIDLLVSMMNGKPFRTAFIGGGNPGMLGLSNMEGICRAVCRNGRPLEFTTEMNPESLSTEYRPLFDQYLTRLSMGVQSLDSKALSFLGRNSSLEQTLKGMELSQTMGCQLSYDLITCLPEWHDALADVKAVTSRFPSNHLSVYALTLEEDTPLGRMNPKLPSEDRQAETLYGIWDHLEGLGFNHYEVSNFAKPGFESLHNETYWSYRQYAGLGCAAASTAFGPDGGIVRWDGGRNTSDYIKSKPFGSYSCEALSAEEAKEEFVIMGLRHRKGLDLARGEREFGLKVGKAPEHYSVKDGFLVPDDEGLMTGDHAALVLLS